jgi:WW domain-containing oxidoreductase
MTNSISFGARSTADQVLAGIDLTGKRMVVTGCGSGIGFATMNALAANGAHVIGLARSFADAKLACSKAGPLCIPLACDLADLNSVAEAAAAIHALQIPLDAVVANAGIAELPTLRTRYGIELQFLVNHVGHFALVNELSGQVRSGTGRIAIVSGAAGIHRAPVEGIMFDNLDGGRFYEPAVFYGQSKLANALFAKELSRRLSYRGVAVNSLDPGATRGTGIDRHLRGRARIFRFASRIFAKPVERGAATQALLAASPSIGAISGEYWSNCQIAKGNPLLQDAELAARLWETTSDIVARHGVSIAGPMREAA